MPRLKFAALALAIVSLPAAAGLSTALAARPAGHPSAAKDHIIVQITTTNGRTWGRVTPDWMVNGKMVMGKVCKTRRCTYNIPHMTKITLAEAPTSPSNWPFKHWALSGSSEGHFMRMNATTITFESMGKTAKAHAVYVFK